MRVQIKIWISIWIQPFSLERESHLGYPELKNLIELAKTAGPAGPVASMVHLNAGGAQNIIMPD